MMKFFKKTNVILIFIIGICFILFLPGFFTYFHQDDFIHLSYSQTPQQLISAFNIFARGEFPFYRPIPTQLYFYLGKSLFGFNPLGFHVVNFLIFVLNILLVFRLIRLITTKGQIAIISSIFFAINVTHFAPLYSAAYVHELFYVMFGLLTIDNYLRWNLYHKPKNYFGGIIFFILALMSKETAVVLPIIILLIALFIDKTKRLRIVIKTLLPYCLILGIYLYGHFLHYGIASGSSYTLIIGKPAINILGWYLLWALSTPNILIDFVGPGIKLSPVFLQVTQFQGLVYFLLFPFLVVIGLFLFLKRLRDYFTKKDSNNFKIIILGLSWFVVGMFPLIIFPLHKLATEQAFSLVGLSLALGYLSYQSLKSTKKYKLLASLFIIIYLVIAINSILLARKTHWIIRSAQQAKNVFELIEKEHKGLKNGDNIYFRNGEVKIVPYGSSRQIYQSLGNGIGLKLILNKPNLNLYFEEINPLPDGLPEKNKVIEIDSSKLLGY